MAAEDKLPNSSDTPATASSVELTNGNKPAITVVTSPVAEPKIAKTLEQRYIELLEEKIARLQAEGVSTKTEPSKENTDSKTVSTS
jgi:hypothetical protein